MTVTLIIKVASIIVLTIWSAIRTAAIFGYEIVVITNGLISFDIIVNTVFLIIVNIRIILIIISIITKMIILIFMLIRIKGIVLIFVISYAIAEVELIFFIRIIWKGEAGYYTY